MSQKVSRKSSKSKRLKGLFYVVSFLIIIIAVYRFYPAAPKRVKISNDATEKSPDVKQQLDDEQPFPQPEEQSPATESDLKNEAVSAFDIKRDGSSYGVGASGNENARLSSAAETGKSAEGAARYNKKGWEMYRNKKYNAALEQFESSLSIEITAKGYLGKGMALTALGSKEAAMDSFESSLELADSSDAHMMIGFLLYRENSLAEAKNHFEKALVINPAKREASAFLSKIKREMIEEGFRENKGSHFIVRYEGTAEGEAGYIVSMILEEAYFDVGSDLGFYPKDMITAILYSDRQFRDVTRSPSWAGGLYDGKIRLPVGGVNSKTEDLKKVIFHEYTHALIHRMTGGNCPIWLNEGLAQHEEGMSSIDRAISLIKSRKKIIPLKNLETSFTGMGGGMASIAYAVSLLSVRYLVVQLGISNVRAILENLKSGMSGEAAVSSAIYMDYREIEKGVISMVKGF